MQGQSEDKAASARKSSAQMTVESAILDGLASTANRTGLVAGEVSRLLGEAIRDSLFAPEVAWAAEEYAREVQAR